MPLSLRSIPLDALNTGSNFLQTGSWGAFKREHGWTPAGFAWKMGELGGSILVLERAFAFGIRLAYVPYGPEIPDALTAEEVTGLLKALAGALRPHLSRGCLLLRFDLAGGAGGPVDGDLPPPDALGPPLKKASYRVQPQDTVILDLSKTEAELLAGMNKKTRYNVGLAEKRGVRVNRFAGPAAVEKLPEWYLMYLETARRDGIAVHSEEYYGKLFQVLASKGGSVVDLYLYTAVHEGDVLAGIVVSRCGSRSTYMYGASRSSKRALMPNHLLQWTAIRDARGEGAGEYDFYGIPPTPNPNHPMHGLWRFKTGFGGRIVHHRGAWDYPYSRWGYAAFARAENFRAIGAGRRKTAKRR